MFSSKFLDPTNEIAFRRIFGTEKNKDLLIGFINHILGLQEANQVQEVTSQPTIRIAEIAARKESVIDVLCKAANGVQFIVEMQVDFKPWLIKNAQYYAAKAYSKQLKRGTEGASIYQDVKAVIFIAICDSIFFKDKEAYLSRHVPLDQETYSQDLEDFSFIFIELPKFKITEIEKLSNIVEKWCYFFKYASSTREADVKKIVGEDHEIERAYEELNQFNWTEEELMIYEGEEKRMMDNQANEDYFFELGRKKGLEEVRQQIKMAKSMLQDGEPIEKIVKCTGLSKQNIEQLKKG
jgi:predicted transposase/invertase (TIGR01784 family)